MTSNRLPESMENMESYVHESELGEAQQPKMPKKSSQLSRCHVRGPSRKPLLGVILVQIKLPWFCVDLMVHHHEPYSSCYCFWRYLPFSVVRNSLMKSLFLTVEFTVWPTHLKNDSSFWPLRAAAFLRIRRSWATKSLLPWHQIQGRSWSCFS